MPGLINRSPLAALGLPAAAFAGVAVVIGLFGPLTNARPLEEVAS
jgi:hypothetical protein